MGSSFAFLVLGVLCWQLQSSASASAMREAVTWDSFGHSPSSRIETGVLSEPNGHIGSSGSEVEGVWELEEIRRLARPGGMYTNTLLVGEGKTPLVFHFDPTKHTLWAVFCLDTMCEKTSSAKVGKGGRSNSALLGADGLPFVAFCQAGSEDGKTTSRLMGFKCSTPSCSANNRDDGYALGTETVLDSDGCDLYTAAAANDDDRPVIAYYRKGGPGSGSGPSTWIAVCLDSHCRQSRRNPLQTQDHGNINGPYPGIVVHAGLPVISVAWRKDAGEVHSSMPALFFCSDALCQDPVSSANIKILAPAAPHDTDDVSKDSSMDVRYTAMSSRLTDIYVLYFDAMSGKAIVATVMDATLIKEKHNFTDASETPENRIETSEVDSSIGDVYGEFPHVAADPLDRGYPAMAYTRQVSHARGDLMLVTCENRDCTRLNRERLAKGKCGFGRDTSMAFNLQEGKAYVSFMDYNSKGSNRSANIAILRSASRATSAAGRNHYAEYDDSRFEAFKDIC